MKRLCFSLLLFLFLTTGAAHASDGFFKGGFMLRPSDSDLSDRWMISFGSDYVMAEQISFGFELESAYYQDSLASTTLRYVPLNAFANVKYKGPFGAVRPFAGGGVGLISTFFNAGDSDYVHDFGFHLVGGIELGSLEGKALILELQGQQAFGDGDNPFAIMFLAGVRF